MKVHLLGTESLAPLFRARGDRVSHGEPLPPDADLYLLGRDCADLRRLERGLVILDLRGDADPALADRLAYADLGLVADKAARAALVEAAGCEPDRLFVVTDDAALLALIERALADALPPAAPPLKEKAPPPVASDLTALTARLDALEGRADIMLRGYRVRSRWPLVAWVRRNLTSHLWEPYLDPTLERQVTLNRELIAILRQLVRRQAELEDQLAHWKEEQKGDE